MGEEDLGAVGVDKGVLRVVINKDVLRAMDKDHLVMVKGGLATLEVVWEEVLEEAGTMVAATMVADRFAPDIHYTHNACYTAFPLQLALYMQPSS